MKKAVLFAAFIMLFALPAFAAESAKDDAAAKADELFKIRNQPGKAKEAYDMLQEAVKNAPENYELLWRYARANFWLADTAENKDAKARYGKEGYTAGKKASTLKPDRVEGYFWGVASLGMYSEGIGILKAIKEGNKGKFEELLNASLKIDKNFDSGGLSFPT